MRDWGEILGFGIETLMSGNEDTPELAPEGIGLEMVWLKTAIDVSDRNQLPQPQADGNLSSADGLGAGLAGSQSAFCWGEK